MQSTQNKRLQVLAAHLAENKSSIDFNQVCGIIGVISHEPVAHFLMDGLKIMEPRGYDSAGITTIVDGKLLTTKFASKGATSNAIALVEEHLPLHKNSLIGIAHTRWATHGGATDRNAHPHLDEDGRIAVVHNGVIENYASIKKNLIDKHGLTFKSETDTEVIAQTIGLFVREGLAVEAAVAKATLTFEGTWGLCVMDSKNPNILIAAKNGSPMLIGLAEGKTFVASETAAFGNQAKRFIPLEDNEIVVLNVENNSLDVTRIQQNRNEAVTATTPDPYAHWTIKEIYEQPEALARALNYGGRMFGDDNVKLGGLSENEEALSNVKHLIIAACGTSLFAGLFGSYLMRAMASFETVQVVDAAEIEDSNFNMVGEVALLVISQSGETKDTHRVVEMAKNKGIVVLSIVNNVGSLIARSATCGVYINAGRENAVASTKAFSSQVTVLSLMAIYFSKLTHRNKRDIGSSARKECVTALHKLPTSFGMCLSKDIHKQCKKVALKLFEKQVDHLFVLGKGAAMPIAYEGALKIKEISYVHAEGFSGGALKHGPFALLGIDTPIIFIVLDDVHAGKMRVAIEEVTARCSEVITITNIPNIWKGYTKEMGEVITIPSNGILTALLAVIPLQFIAYELSILKGINPDRPRHLAKTVTVD